MKFSPIPFLSLAFLLGGCADTNSGQTPAVARVESIPEDIAESPPPPMEVTAKDMHADYVARVVIVRVPGVKTEDAESFFRGVKSIP